MTARDVARKAFWSERHPLAHLYAIANGQWIEGEFRPVTQWSLRELIAFTEQLPPSIVARVGGAA